MVEKDCRTSVGYLLAGVLLLMVIAGCLFYAQGDRLLVRYHSSIALTADQPLPASEAWLLERGSLAMPMLVDYLRRPDPTGCDRAASLLARLLAANADPTAPSQAHFSLAMATRLHEKFQRLSAVGRAQAVEIVCSILEIQLGQWSPTVPTALETAGHVLHEALDDADKTVQEKALWWLASVWSWNGADNVARSLVDAWKRKCYLRAVELLDSSNSGLRCAAARAIRGAPFHEGDTRLIALLGDSVIAVRKSALLALVHKADSLGFEQRTKLFSLLHDPDREVQEATVQLLMNAGGNATEIRLAMSIKHPSALERIKAARLAATAPGGDAGWWLARLLEDENAGVRLAAVRNSIACNDGDLRAKLTTLANGDPDAAVRAACKERLATRIASKK